MVNETFIPIAAAAPSVNGGFSAGLDKFLAVIIPIAIFGVFFYMIYNAFKDPLDRLFAWIKEKWLSMNPPPEEQHSARYSGIVFDNRAELYK